jgi:apolipoprotein N-acyltransferase
MRFLRRLKAWALSAPGRCFWWGLACALALPPLHLLPVLLVAVPAFLRLLGGAKDWRAAAWRGWLFAWGFQVAGLYWITEPMIAQWWLYWWLVPTGEPALAAVIALLFYTPGALVAYWVRPGFPRVLVFAGGYAAAEMARQLSVADFIWNAWGTDWAIPGKVGTVMIQLANVVGVYGLTFLTVLVAASPLLGRRGIFAAAMGLGAWAGFGFWHLSLPTTPPGVKLALVQPDFPVPGLYDRASLLGRWRQLEEMSAAGLRAGASAVVWPEGASPWLLDTDSAARAQLAVVMGTVPVIAGSLRIAGADDYRNSIVVTDGPGPVVGIYDKWQLVPFGEYMPRWVPLMITPKELGSGFSPGGGPETLHIPGLPPVGPFICYEAVYSGQIVDERDRPAWLVNVTDDSWFGNSAGPRQHFADVRLRAVEEGLPIARAANSGISGMVDAFGRVNSRLPLGAEGVLMADLPGDLPRGVYARLGLWVPFMLVVGAMVSGLLISVFGTHKLQDSKHDMSI